MAFNKRTKIALLIVLVTWLIGGYRCGMWMRTMPDGNWSYTSSSTQSKSLGVFNRQLQVSRRLLRHDSLYSLAIEEAYLEYYWVCTEGCTVANARDSVGKYLIVRLRPGSDATHLQETYFIRQPDREIDFVSYHPRQPDGTIVIDLAHPGVLLAHIGEDMEYGYPAFPLKFYVYSGRFGKKKEQILVDSITFY